jgi:hypothetical protein
MAIQPPPAPSAPATAAAAPPPPKSGGCAGCSFGCLGCLLVVVLVAVAVLGGGYYFFVVQAQAGVAAPAALVVVTDPVERGHNDSGYQPARSGDSLAAGSSVRTGHTGHATIQFPDGSLTRLSPDTTVTITAAQLNTNGSLRTATLQQKVGRTLNSVQHLLGGSSFQVGGHSVSAQVRGTEFEILVRSDGTNLIKVFDGTVQVSGQTTITLTAGQQVDADANGKLSAPRPIQGDPQDAFAQAAQCSKAAAANNNAGTTQTSGGEGLAAGQTSTVGYDSAGGDFTAAVCYPGSLMSITVTDPNGGVHAAQGPPPLFVRIPNGPPGHYTAVVRAILVPTGGEAFAVSFATNAACSDQNIDSGGVVRQSISNAQLAQSLSQSGATGITLEVQGTSASSARIYYRSDFGGLPITWTIDVYAATPGLGLVITQVTVRGVNVTTQLISNLKTLTDKTSIPTDFVVDRVYSCLGPGGNMAVIEGHRS